MSIIAQTVGTADSAVITLLDKNFGLLVAVACAILFALYTYEFFSSKVAINRLNSELEDAEDCLADARGDYAELLRRVDSLEFQAGCSEQQACNQIIRQVSQTLDSVNAPSGHGIHEQIRKLAEQRDSYKQVMEARDATINEIDEVLKIGETGTLSPRDAVIINEVKTLVEQSERYLDTIGELDAERDRLIKEIEDLRGRIQGLLDNYEGP